ncbi:hypothetical protein NEMBOFW57_008936 [Staphylotrichum longicolle]|uniref:FAD dependent oxidoreductase domain-containing protein n=1 Tax=Staphylotrichum longicolle TaxID=669026 RepID=A0AAD4ESZ7_9PEZI|nr:hypothetical protein NEMBOFW57_008936 [Staphylotrichum longicolle]
MAPLTSASAPPPSSTSSSPPFSPPSSILIIGSGVFGLSTALALTRRDAFAQCSITVVDRSDPSQPGAFPSPDAASVDTSRIIRADYADPAYAALCDEAQVEWRKQDKPTDLGSQGRYNETGLLLVGDETPPAPAAAPASDGLKPKLTGMDYTRMSWANVVSLASKDPELAARVRELPNPDAIRDALGTGGSSGSWGYINNNSGWANATASMAWYLDRVQQTGRVNFVPGTVVSLEHNNTTVTGAKLSDGRVLSADLVVVAAGAWTGGLVDLAGQALATGQVLGYLDITEEEQSKLANMPVILNLSTGLFIIPPTDRALKLARHAYGYINPTRLCWYSDTPTGDFLIDYHPNWRGLFVATGDSGHAFKFLPVIGDRIVDCIRGECPVAFRGKWGWKVTETEAGTTGKQDGFVFTEDGSRGGKAGLVLAEELAKADGEVVAASG